MRKYRKKVSVEARQWFPDPAFGEFIKKQYVHSKDVKPPLYSQSQVGTLLDAMARSVVEEAAKISRGSCDGELCEVEPCQACWTAALIEALLTPEKLAQLREAVQRI